MHTQTALIEWLCDAYAMEKSLETALKKLTAHPHTHEALRERAARHCTQTRHHVEALVTCLKRCGSDTPLLQTTPVQERDLMRSAGSVFGREERIRDVLAVLVTEHFEIATQTILRAGAAELGQQDIVAVCDDILLEEKRMTRWLQINLPQIIATYLAEEPVAAMEVESVQHSGPTANGNPKSVAQWEFVQMAQTSSLLGVQPHTRAFASRLN